MTIPPTTAFAEVKSPQTGLGQDSKMDLATTQMIQKEYFVMNNNNKHLILLLAPSGAGKTTRIREHYEHLNCIHINRDAITADLFEAHGIDALLPSLIDREKIRHILEHEAEPAYYERLQGALTQNDKDIIVVDYPPGGHGEWIVQTLRMAKDHEWLIEIEGIYIDPKVSIERVLNRNGARIAPDEVGAYVENSQHELSSWLGTYQKFPEQFLAAAQYANRATLWQSESGNIQSPPVIAYWQRDSRHPQILDTESYNKFLSLQKIVPCQAHLKISFEESGNKTVFKGMLENLHGVGDSSSPYRKLNLE